MQNSAIKGRLELHVNAHKDLEMLILPVSIILITRLTLD